MQAILMKLKVNTKNNGESANRSRRIFLHSDSFLIAEFIKKIDGIDFFGNVAYQKIYVVLRNLQTTMTEKPR